MATTESREARRRKILERGSERLGLITGQIRDIPRSISDLNPSQVFSQPSDSPDDSQPSPLLSDHITGDKASHSVLRERVIAADAGRSNTDNGGGSSMGPTLHGLETLAFEAFSQIQSSTVASAVLGSLGGSSAAGRSLVRDISVKILERGSEHLGLITGLIQDIPTSSPRSNSHLQPNVSSQPCESLDDGQPCDSLDDDQSSPPLSNQITVPPQAEDKVSNSVLHQRVVAADVGQPKANNGGQSSIKPTLHGLETLVSEVFSQMQSSNAASAVLGSLLGSSSAAGRSVVRDISVKTVFTPDQINSAITATEKTRLICSATIAFIIVLSGLGFPKMGNYIKEHIITFRPLCLVLLTNLTVVLARLLFRSQKGFERAGKLQKLFRSSDGIDWAEGLSKFLEIAFLMRKVLDAVFMDCSVYTLIVICGLALAG